MAASPIAGPPPRAPAASRSSCCCQRAPRAASLRGLGGGRLPRRRRRRPSSCRPQRCRARRRPLKEGISNRWTSPWAVELAVDRIIIIGRERERGGSVDAPASTAAAMPAAPYCGLASTRAWRGRRPRPARQWHGRRWARFIVTTSGRPLLLSVLRIAASLQTGRQGSRYTAARGVQGNLGTGSGGGERCRAAAQGALASGARRRRTKKKNRLRDAAASGEPHSC